MPKFEYTWVLARLTRLKDMVDKLGSEGWELVCSDKDGYLYFKRELPKPKKTLMGKAKKQ